MAIDLKRNNLVFGIHVIITVFFMFFFGFLPAYDPITPLGMKLLGIFIGIVYAWTTTSLLWPSFLGMVAIVVSGACPMEEFLTISFANSTVVFLILILVFTTAINKAGLINFIAAWLMSRKTVAGRPWLFSYFILLGALIGGTFVSTVASVLIFWSILYTVCEKFDYKPYDKYPSLMILGIVMCSMTFGGSVMPFRLTGLVMTSTLSAATGGSVQISFGDYVLFSSVTAFLFTTFYLLLMRFVFRIDLSAMSGISADLIDKSALELSKRQKVVFSFLIFMIILLFLPDFLPDAWAVTSLLTNLGTCGIMLILLVIMMIVNIDGEPILTYKEAVKGVDWDMVYLFAVILPFSSLLTTDATGVKPFMLQILNPVLNASSFLTFMISILVIDFVLTNFMNNAVLGIIFVNLCAPICISLGISPAPMIMVLMWTNQFAYMTPAASAPAAFVFGNSEWIKASGMYKYIAITLLLLFIFALAIGIPYANLIFK